MLSPVHARALGGNVWGAMGRPHASVQVGMRLSLVTREHGISATVVITSTCTFSVYSLTGDGQAPDLYLWASVNGTR